MLQNPCVQVKIELGHRATLRKKKTQEGFTHDWVVFVRGPEGSNIQHFVDRVVFHLHESFPKPKRSKYGLTACLYVLNLRKTGAQEELYFFGPAVQVW